MVSYYTAHIQCSVGFTQAGSDIGKAPHSSHCATSLFKMLNRIYISFSLYNTVLQARKFEAEINIELTTL